MQLHLKMEKKGPKQTNLCPCLGEAWRMLMGFLGSAVHAKHSARNESLLRWALNMNKETNRGG